MFEILNITKAMSDENRVRALMMLTGGELCVCQIIEMLGLAPSTVSKHMSILRQAGLVQTRKQGRWMHYSLVGKDAPNEVRKAIEWLISGLKKKTKIPAGPKEFAETFKNRQGKTVPKTKKLKTLFLRNGNLRRSKTAKRRVR